MENYLQKVLITDLIVTFLALALLLFFISKKVWAGAVFAFFCVLSFSYGSFRCFSLLHTKYVEVEGITTGYTNTLKSTGSIKFYFFYGNKRYEESSNAYKNLNLIVSKGGKYRVRVCQAYPLFNEIDFENIIREK